MMTIDQVIKLGEDLKAFAADGPMPASETPVSALPPGCPLYTSLEEAGKMFGLGLSTMRGLLKNNADFPAVRIGTKYIVDVPGMYGWMHERNGEALET